MEMDLEMGSGNDWDCLALSNQKIFHTTKHYLGTKAVS